MPPPTTPAAATPTVLSAAERAAITARAVAAATAVAVRHGLRVDAPAVLADRYAVRVHLRPAPVVARVSTHTALLRAPILPWLARELDVTRFLASRGAPVVPPSALLPAGPHLEDGFGVSFWEYAPSVSDQVPAPAVAGRMLAELHHALRDYPGDLPLVAPPLNDIPRGLERLARLGDVVSRADLDLLRALADRLLPLVEHPPGPLQPLHGDAHAHNLIVTAQGPVWNDFEDTCRGPIAWDLSTLADADGELLAAYPDAPSPATLAPYRQVRLLHAAVWVFALHPEFDAWAVHARAIVDGLRALV